MRSKYILLVIQLILILIFVDINLFSITIQPINLIFGVISTLFLPGYNIINIIKPQLKFTEKLGYLTVLSLTIESIFLFFFQLFFYNFVSFPETNISGLIYDRLLLIIAISIINLILIFFNESKKLKLKSENQKSFKLFSFKSRQKKIDIKTILVFITFAFLLYLLCLSTLFSDLPSYYFSEEYYYFNANYLDYRSNFIFFYRVPFIFYIFLALSILNLIYIVFLQKIII